MSWETTAVPYPETVEAMTADWFSAALGDRFPGARVTSVELVKRIDGTATKLRYALAGEGGELPPSLWVKGSFDPRGASQGDAFLNEVRFFRDLAPQLPIDRPDCYFGLCREAGKSGLVLLEDLINRGASFGHATAPLAPDQAAAVLSLQAAYHAAFWRDRRLHDIRWLKAGGAIAGAGMVGQFFSFWEGVVALPRFAHVTPLQRDKARSAAALERLIEGIAGEAECLVHGDSHIANLYFNPDGSPGYLDWQHVMRGCWAFDVANFMVTSLSVADRRGSERALLQHYLEELARHGAEAPGFDEAWRQYRRYAMWPFMWVMCPVEAHPEEVCTLNSERACAAVEDLETIQLLERE